MKIKLTLLLISLFVFNIKGNTQELTPSEPDFDHKVEITPLVGYQLNGNLNFVQGDMSFQNSINYGIGIGVNAGYGTFIEAMYSFSASESYFRSFSPYYEDQRFKTDIHFIQLSGLKEFIESGRIRPFGTIGVGASGFVPKEPQYNSWWSFAMTLGLGAKINITQNIGIRLQARLLMPLTYAGMGLYCGGGGCGGGLTASSTVISGDFMGGLIFGF